jgi:thiol:disulfide interchange protein DsbA
MNRRDFSLAALGAAGTLGAFSPAGHALAQGAPTEGQNFVRLSQPAPVTVAADKKIDVVEFFWYGCPHCNALEPLLERWIARLPADVGFRRVHVGFGAIHQIHQKLFYALEETGQLPALHKKVFAAMHQQGRRLNTDADISAFIKENGGDAAKFMDSYKGFSVNTKATRAKQLSDAYKIDGVPAIGVHGRFYTSASLPGNGSHERMLAVAEFLIQRSRQA